MEDYLDFFIVCFVCFVCLFFKDISTVDLGQMSVLKYVTHF